MRRRVAVLAVVLGLATACGSAEPTLAELRAEPILQPLPGEVVLATKTLSPRRSQPGRIGRDGVVERVVQVERDPVAVADEIASRNGERYQFRRTELPAGAPQTVELRGTSPTGADIIVVASVSSPVPLIASLADVRAPPVPSEGPVPQRTSVVTTVLSRQ
jgi:hypothetical protein